MADSRALYEQVIIDHTKNPRNFRELASCDCKNEGFNPLCGDHFTIYVKLDGSTIEDVAFTGAGCAISKSSASMMTMAVKGKTIDEAKDLFVKFHQMVTAAPDETVDADSVGKLRVFSGVREYPMRIKCATLAWHTLTAALEGKEQPVTTE